MAKRVWKAKEVIKGWNEKPIKITGFEDPFDEDSAPALREMRILDAMLLIVNRTDSKTLEDSSKKRALKQALVKAVKTGRIELEPDVYKWLKTASEAVSPTAWQDNGNEVHDIISEGFSYDNEPSKSAKTKASKEAPDAPPAE